MTEIPKKKIIILLIIGFLLGIIWFVGVRFALYEKEAVHYHANFLLVIDGHKQEFDNFTFYEEVQACGLDDGLNPKVRAHMHDEVNHVIHVHDEGVTWGHFFANLGYTLGNKVLVTDEGMFTDKDKSELVFLLNGKEVQTITNEVIRSEDALVILYGEPEEHDPQDPAAGLSVLSPIDQAKKYYDELQKDAGEYNQKADPSACSGGKPATNSERFKAAIGF